MAAKQMEEIQKKLGTLNYPRANAPSQSLLFAGMERYALLEWLFFKLLGDKSPFSQQNLQGDNAVDRDEETSRIQYLAEIAKFLGITTTVDPEAIQGRGSYEERMEMLRLIVDLVEASIYADNPEWSVDEQVAKDIQLIDAIAEKQGQIFSEECKLFPADVQIQSIYPLPDISDLEKQLSDQSNRLLSLQEMVDDLASKHPYNPDEEYVDVEAKLRGHLESFLDTARTFNTIYTKEIRPWTHMMEVPQLHGFGPAANRLLEAYKMLWKFLGNLKNLRDSHAAVALGSSETVAGEPSSVTRIISECETALTLLNRDLAILSASIARERGSIFAFTKATNNGFSLDLIHRDSTNSPFYDPSLSYTKRINNSFHRSLNRSKDFGSRSSIIVASNNGEYLMKFSLGTPPVHSLGVADTGSDLTWTQCLPCKNCFKQQPLLFNPKKSSTYKSLPCNSKKCHAPFSTSCNRTKRTCEYQVMYGDQSYSVGDLATEMIRFGSSKNTQVSLKNTIIGCGHNNAGTFSGDKESGIVGLGGGKFSLISQMGSSIGGKFSYCLAPLSQHNHVHKSKIHFGANAIVFGNKVVTTPLAKKSPATFYFLTLEGVSVGKKRLDFRKVSFSFGEGNIVLDSGTVLTLFSPEIYVKLEAMVKEEIKLPTVTDPTGALSLCYKSLSVEKIPIITMHFKGADVKLGPLNTFVETSESSMCFAFAASYGVSIYGNIAQMNFLVGYDLKRRSISFKAADCSKQ